MKNSQFHSRSHQVAAELRRRIEEDNLADGELFMTEGEVAKQYGVSHTLAREAVGQLRALGLVEGRQSKGLIVRRPNPVRLFESCLPLMGKSPNDVAELSTLRYGLEVGTIELAVLNASNEQIARLVELAHDYQRAAEKGDESSLSLRGRLDVAFHTLLLEMTGSTLIAGMQRVLVDFFHKLAGELQSHPSLMHPIDRAVREHIELAAAIRDRDVECARSILSTHLRPYLPTDVAAVE